MGKKKSWHWAPFSSLPPSCQWPFSCTSPYFPGDSSHSPFISALLLHCCGLRILLISSVNSAQRGRCSHANIHLSDWEIVYHANNRWGQLLSLLHMSNLHPPARSLDLIHAIFSIFFDALCTCVHFILSDCALALDNIAGSCLSPKATVWSVKLSLGVLFCRLDSSSLLTPDQKPQKKKRIHTSRFCYQLWGRDTIKRAWSYNLNTDAQGVRSDIYCVTAAVIS